MNDLNEDNKRKDFLLTFSDLLTIIKKNSRKIGMSSLIFAMLAFYYGLTRPVQYEAEATFKEKGKSQSGLGNSLSAAFLMLPENGDSSAMTILRSRTLIEHLIQQQDLQGVITKKERSFSLIPFQTIKNNLLVEYAHFKNLKNPVLNDSENDLHIRDIAYHGEVPITLSITVISPEKFMVDDGRSQEFREGTFNQPFFNNEYSFILSQLNSKPINENQYSLVLLPLQLSAELFAKQFKVEPDKNDKNLLKIIHKNGNRLQAAAHINALMRLYQDYIECEHEQICKKQVGYLVARQKEMGQSLETMMKDHAHALSSDLSSTGFATSEKAMEFLASSQHDLKHKLLTLNLEIQRLEKAAKYPLNNDVFSSISKFDVINKIATEKRLLKQQADSLNLVLRNIPSQTQDFQNTFASQLDDVKNIKKSIKDSDLALASIQRDEIPQNHPELSGDSQSVYKAWLDRLVDTRQKLDNNPSSKECKNDWEQCKTGFSAYLSNLNHFLNVYQRNIEERLAHQQAPLKEFQGINLNVAETLYISYSTELSQAESLSTQHEFTYSQLNKPDFEVGSLSTILNDPLSLDIISRASNIILALKDQDNRSTKEQDRLNADLAIQKGFLKTHIQQSIALLALRQNFLREKIRHLQSLNLSLIHEQISILENQIKEYISSSLENLHQEKELLEKNLIELRIEMAAFPQKWASEQLIQQQMEINRNLVEEISKLVESKNISNNLEKMQSAPVDHAYPPIHPKSPRLFALSLIGAILGAFLGLAWTLGRSVMEGIKASAANLKAGGLQVCGHLSRSYEDTSDRDPLLDEDLSTLRRLIAYIDPQDSTNGSANTLLLLEGKGPNYAVPLAELMSRKGLKVLILELRFDEVGNKDSRGVLQYLEGKIEKPEIVQGESFDRIISGGICRYANERIGSQKLQDLIAELSKKYDWIIINSSAMPKSAEAENLLELFPCAAISVTEETLDDLKVCIARAHDSKHKIAFLLAG